MKRPRKAKVAHVPTMAEEFSALRLACASDFNAFADSRLSKAVERIDSALVKPELDGLCFAGEILVYDDNNVPAVTLLEKAYSLLLRLREGELIGYPGWGSNVIPGPNWDFAKVAEGLWAGGASRQAQAET